MAPHLFRIILLLTLVFTTQAGFGQPCPAVNDPGDFTVCSGGTLDVVFTSNSPTATYNWTASLPIFGGLNGSGNIFFSPIPTIPFPISVTFTVTATENGCTGPPQTFIVSGFPAPSGSLALTGPADICAGQTAVFTVNFSNGAAPYSFIYAIDGAEQAPVTTSANPYTLNVALSNSATVNLVSVTSNTCTINGTGSGSVNVTPLPTATLSAGNSTLCSGEAQDLEINFTGAGPFNFVHRVNGVNQPVITTAASSYTLSVMPNAGTYAYTLASVTSNGCAGTVSGSYNLTVNQAPAAVLSGDATVCAGQSSILTINFSGGGPYTVNYTADGVAQSPINTAANPYTFSVTPFTTTTYELAGVAANGCAGSLAGGALITVTAAPVATLTSGSTVICNGQAVQLQLTFNGNDNYTFTYQFNGLGQAPITAIGPAYQFTAPSGNGSNVYTLATVSANGCPGTTSGTYTAVVGSAPVAMLSGTQGTCPGVPAPLMINFSGNGPFAVNYTANNIAQLPITTPNDPFIFNVTPASTTTYALTGLNANGCTGTFSGQAIVAISPGPMATLVSGGDTLCSGAADTLLVYLSGGGPYTFVYSVDSISQPPITTTLDTFWLPVVPAVGQDTVRLVSVSNAACSGTVSGQFIFKVHAPPFGTFSADTTICGGDTAQLRLNFSGTAPFIYNYSAAGVLQGADTVAINKDTLLVAPLVTTTYILTSVSGAGCPGTLSDTVIVTVNPAPTAAVSGGGQVCQNGSGTQIMFSFQGPGPYTFVYSINNVAQPAISTTVNPYVLNVNPAIGTFYRLVSVTNGTCTGTVSGQAVVFVFSPPTAQLSGSNTFCTSADTSVVVDFTGTGPFTIYYTQNGVAQPPVTTFDDPYFLPVNVTTTTTYTLTATESPGCTGISTGSATITINYLPSYANLDIQCDAASANYQVEFDVLNGSPPYTLITGAGTFTGNHFVSNPLPVAQNYNFVFHDSGNCGNTTVSGLTSCNCTTDAGAMDLATVEICVTDTLVVAPATGTFLDADDTLLYVLHTNPGLPLGTVLAWSNQPQFAFQPGMQTGLPYYISSIAGNVAANGQVDQNDPCRSVAQGTPIIFHATPTGLLAALDTSICLGESVALPIIFTGTSPFSFVYAIDGLDQAAVNNINSSNYDLPLSPASSITVQLVSISDQYCQSGASSGQANIGVHAAPQLGNATVVCDFDSLTYVLSFDVQSGTSPYDLTGISGNFSGNTFTSTSYPFGEPYFIYIRDTFDCGVDTLIGVPGCACTSDAGTMSSTALLSLCLSNPAVVAHNGDQVFDNDDALAFVLHTNPNNILGSILATSGSSVFGFLPGTMSAGTTYYVSAVVGNSDGAGGVVLTDLCLSVAPGQPVVWRIEPTGTISGSYDVCRGVPLAINLSFTGQAPFLFSYTNNGQTVNSMAAQSTFNIIANLQQSATFILTSVQDANCPGTVSGQAVVTVHQAPVITNPVVTCAADNQSYTVEFDVANGAAAAFSGTVPGNFDQTTGHFSSNSIPMPQNYAFQVTDSLFNCGSDSISGAAVCACTTDAGNFSQTPLVLCVGDTATTPAATGFVLDGNDTLLYYLATMSNPPTWTVLGISPTPDFAYNAGTMTPGTTYYIVALAGDVLGGNVDLNDPCRSFATGPSVVWRVPPTATLSGTGNICPGGSADLLVQFTGPGPFDLTYAANGQPQMVTVQTNGFTLTVQPADTTLYTLVGVTDAGSCPGTVSGSATVTVHQPPTATLMGDTTLCQGGSAAFQIQLTGAAPFQLVYALNGNPQAVINAPLNTFFISTSNVLTPQTYTLISVQDSRCAGTVSGMATVQVNPAPTASIQPDLTVCAGDSAQLTLQLSGGTSYDVTISGGAGLIQLDSVQNGAVVSVSPGITTTYTISNLVAGSNACPALLGAPATVTVSSLMATAVVSVYGAFNVSCSNAADGSIVITPIGGVLPITASWTNGASGLQLDDLTAGSYAVVLTDQAGCTFRDSFLLTAAPALDVQYATQAPPCFGDINGGLTIGFIGGGTGPYTLGLNGQGSQPVDSLPFNVNPLPTGSYTLSVADVNGCTTEETVLITAPPQLLVDLGPDVVLSFGDSTLLEAEVNSNAVFIFQWTPTDYLQQPTDQATWAKPPQTQTYAVLVEDTSGCQASDRILVMVDKTRRVYIPNIIHLRSDTYNNVLAVFAGPEVSNVRFLRVYDRWGECVYEGLDLPANDPQFGWSGVHRGQLVLPGVYVYVTEVQYFDGSTEVFYGDVTVVH